WSLACKNDIAAACAAPAAYRAPDRGPAAAGDPAGGWSGFPARLARRRRPLWAAAVGRRPAGADPAGAAGPALWRPAPRAALATAFFGVVDETGARLALKLGPLPAIQTSEILKLALIIFLAEYIAREGEKAQARGRPVLGGRLRLPAARYVVPGLLFVAMAT